LNFSFKESDIIDGNGLRVEVKTSDDSLLKAEGYSYAPVRISWKNIKFEQLGDYSFSHDKAVFVNKGNTMIWGNCVDTASNPITIVCDKVGTHKMEVGSKLNSKVIAQQDIVLAWSTRADKETSIVYLMNHEGEIKTFKFKGIIHDAGFMATNKEYYAFLVFDHNRVEIWSLNKNDLSEFEQFRVLDMMSVNSHQFCPVAVSIPPKSSNEFDILCDCGFHGKEVFRMGLTYGVNSFRIPLSGHHHTRGFCSFLGEFVIDTQAGPFSVSPNDTFNYWSIPMEEFEANYSYTMYCLPTLDKVAYVAQPSEGLRNTVIVQNTIENGINQGVRFPNIVDGIEAERIQVFELLDRIVFVVQDMEKIEFVTSFDTPRIKFTAGEVDDEEDVTVTITVKNKESEQTFLQLATIYPH